jgi:hypothetical protein
MDVINVDYLVTTLEGAVFWLRHISLAKKADRCLTVDDFPA